MRNYFCAEDRAKLSREIAREGIILLKNEDRVLPLGRESVAVFGRTQIDMIKCGTGSAYCESEYCIDILSGLEDADIRVDTALAKRYRAWSAAHSLSSFGVWGSGSHLNPEMPLEEDVIAEAAQRNQKAIVVIGRTAGENDDVNVQEGDFLLSSEEQLLMDRVCRHFSNVIVVINSGNLIHMGFTCRPEVKAILLLNLPGMEGGNALADILSGAYSPSAKLPDTISYEHSDHPSSHGFGKAGGIVQKYTEDIFVGYRYFETFLEARDRVMYPFGFGLSYTEFDVRCLSFECGGVNGEVRVQAAVKNIGDTWAGKEVVMLYSSAPKSALGTPAYELKTFGKTGLLAPGEEEVLTLTFPVNDMASFDDTGVLGTKDAWMLLKGGYTISMGNNIRALTPVGTFTCAQDTVVKTCTHLPTQLKKRLTIDGTYEELESIPVDMTLGVPVDPMEETVITAHQFRKIDGNMVCLMNVAAPGVYRISVSGGHAGMKVDLNRIPVDRTAQLFSEEGLDLILTLKTNALDFHTDNDDVPAEVRLVKNNAPIVIHSEGTSYIEGGKFSECGLWSGNCPFVDEHGPIRKGRALRRMHSPGRNATYKLEVEKPGVYDVRLRYIFRHPDRDLRDTFTFLISNVGQDVEPVLLKQTTTDKDHRPRHHEYVTSAPFTLALPQGECYLKIVSATTQTPVIAYFELTPTDRPLYTAKESGGNTYGTMDGKKLVRPVLPPQTNKYDLRSVLRGEITLDDLLDDLSDEELVQLTCGNKAMDERIGGLIHRGIPGAMWSDGPVGLRQDCKVTVYPSSTMISASWNKPMAEEYGRALGHEANRMNIDVWLAPAMNIHRNPCCGRNFEYYSEDPVLSGIMAAQVVKGVQSMHIAATAKHFAANNTEYQRLQSNSRVSARAMFEIYMRGFELLIREGQPHSIMSAYNHINGVKASEIFALCTGVVRDDFGFTGVLMSDFGNDSDHIRELAAGHDLKMPYGNIPAVVAAMNNGTLARVDVETCARRVLKMLMATTCRVLGMTE
ncbi:MAG: glycoside hydrolase family 3 protein [Clostridia bacterium]|nr:glycoside hydrolase family 3 protein [Clostridia bacterium]